MDIGIVVIIFCLIGWNYNRIIALQKELSALIESFVTLTEELKSSIESLNNSTDSNKPTDGDEHETSCEKN